MATAFPLSWPEGFPRATRRDTGKFKTSLAGALENVRTSLRLFGTDAGRAVAEVVMSSNVTLGVAKPADPGVAVWFIWDGEQRCIPVDRYSTVEANLQAIHHIVEARRVELRHGTLALVRASFKGFTPALLPPKARTWRDVFGAVGPYTAEMVEMRFRELARTRHPDAGGSSEAMAELNTARSEALREVST